MELQHAANAEPLNHIQRSHMDPIQLKQQQRQRRQQHQKGISTGAQDRIKLNCY